MAPIRRAHRGSRTDRPTLGPPAFEIGRDEGIVVHGWPGETLTAIWFLSSHHVAFFAVEMTSETPDASLRETSALRPPSRAAFVTWM